MSVSAFHCPTQYHYANDGNVGKHRTFTLPHRLSTVTLRSAVTDLYITTTLQYYILYRHNTVPSHCPLQKVAGSFYQSTAHQGTQNSPYYLLILHAPLVYRSSTKRNTVISHTRHWHCTARYAPLQYSTSTSVNSHCTVMCALP
jgi:hypothetical protein